MKVDLIRLSDISPDPDNPRKISTKAVTDVAESIRLFGWRQPIVVDSDMVIRAGHTRYLAALDLGLEAVPVHVASDVTAEQMRAYQLADNRTHELAEWDDDLLGPFLAGLEVSDEEQRYIDGLMEVDADDSAIQGLADGQSKEQWTTLFDLVEASGLSMRSMIVWDKCHPGLGALWRTQHELIGFATRGSTKRTKGIPANGNVIQAKRSGNRFHYTEKPTDLMEQILIGDRCSDRGGCPVIDPFMGSGTTLLAAEAQDRVFYGCELEPRFVDVAVQRWRSAGGTAERVSADD